MKNLIFAALAALLFLLPAPAASGGSPDIDGIAVGRWHRANNPHVGETLSLKFFDDGTLETENLDTDEVKDANWWFLPEWDLVMVHGDGYTFFGQFMLGKHGVCNNHFEEEIDHSAIYLVGVWRCNQTNSFGFGCFKVLYDGC
jgi:hypothetical protein